MDLALNAYANARWHHELKKKHALKQSKTLEANVKAFKAAEKRTAVQLTQACARRHCRCVHGLRLVCAADGRKSSPSLERPPPESAAWPCWNAVLWPHWLQGSRGSALPYGKLIRAPWPSTGTRA